MLVATRVKEQKDYKLGMTFNAFFTSLKFIVSKNLGRITESKISEIFRISFLKS